MSMFRFSAAAAVVAALLVSGWNSTATANEPAKTKLKLKTKNVILVMTDGVRWQEIFRGADSALMNKEAGGVADVEGLKTLYGQETVEQRREALLPFIAGVIGKEGQLYGNEGEESRVTNGKNFSYPGYSEILVGFGDDRIDSNNKFNNPNVTVFEWLNNKDAFRDKVSCFGTWDVIPYILNRERSGLKIVTCWERPQGENLTPQEILLGDIIENTHRIWPDNSYDSFSFHTALEDIKREKPRLVYIGLGEPDVHAHGGRYDQYLRSINIFDEWMKRLWDTVQSMPEYKDQTTLILTTDHGRGDAPEEWKHHGEKIKGAERIWIGVLGPDTPAKGDSPLPNANQNQIAATLAALLGEDYNADQPKAGPVIQRALPQADGR